MATSATQLADEIRSAMGFPTPVSAQLTGWAKGTLEELTQNGIATFGLVAGPHPISGMSAASMASKVAGYAEYPGVSAELLGFCKGIVDHIQGSGFVTYTGTPTGSGPTEWALGGKIFGLSGSGMASQVASDVPYPNVSGPLLQFCTAVASHISTNASVVLGVIS